jgi:predicted  nucleic acid-binding Zn-ribbon protein
MDTALQTERVPDIASQRAEYQLLLDERDASTQDTGGLKRSYREMRNELSTLRSEKNRWVDAVERCRKDLGRVKAGVKRQKLLHEQQVAELQRERDGLLRVLASVAAAAGAKDVATAVVNGVVESEFTY